MCSVMLCSWEDSKIEIGKVVTVPVANERINGCYLHFLALECSRRPAWGACQVREIELKIPRIRRCRKTAHIKGSRIAQSILV